MRDESEKASWAQITGASEARLRLDPGKFWGQEENIIRVLSYKLNLAVLRKMSWKKEILDIGIRLRGYIAFGSSSNTLKMCIGFDPEILLL